MIIQFPPPLHIYMTKITTSDLADAAAAVKVLALTSDTADPNVSASTGLYGISYAMHQDKVMDAINGAVSSGTAVDTLLPCPSPYKSIGVIKQGEKQGQINLCIHPDKGYLCSMGHDPLRDLQHTKQHNQYRYAAIATPEGTFANPSGAGEYPQQAKDWAATASQTAMGQNRPQTLIPACNVEAIMLENMHDTLNGLPNKIAEAMKSATKATKANDSSASVRYDDSYDYNRSNRSSLRDEEYDDYDPRRREAYMYPENDNQE